MPRTKLTARVLSVLGPVDGKRTEYFDEALPGFSLRVAASGRKSFSVLYRSGRRLRRYTLGRYPVLGLAQARDLARAALAEAALGGDPALKKLGRRRALSFAELASEYLELHARPNKKTWREDERRIRKTLLPAFRHIPATDIKRAHVRDLVDAILLRGASYEANRTHAQLRKMFNWAVARDLVEKNPVAGLPRPAKERRRQHVLREDEIRRFWEALDREPAAVAASLKLRLYTAQRGGEVLTMRWEDVELSTGWWTIPGERSKNDLSHRVFLVPAARALLPGRADSPWVFPNRDGTGPMSSTQKSIERIRRRAAIELRGHDLRRTAASHMASIGVPRLVIAKILNHVERGVTAVYDRYSYDREKREALEAWARRLETIIETSDAGDDCASIRLRDRIPKREGDMSEDKRLVRLTKIGLALPEAERELKGRHARFHAREKTFAGFLDDHHGDGIVSVSCKMAPGENREVAELDPKRFYLPAYMAHQGWVAFRLDVGKVDWTEVEELVKESYRLVAPKTLAALV